jgi:lipopolysaccharide export LptBFGC system permease protein LptF
VAIVVIGLYITDKITGTTAIVLLALSAIFVLTSLISFCPLYLPFGISTSGKNEKE